MRIKTFDNLLDITNNLLLRKAPSATTSEILHNLLNPGNLSDNLQANNCPYAENRNTKQFEPNYIKLFI